MLKRNSFKQWKSLLLHRCVHLLAWPNNHIKLILANVYNLVYIQVCTQIENPFFHCSFLLYCAFWFIKTQQLFPFWKSIKYAEPIVDNELIGVVLAKLELEELLKPGKLQQVILFTVI